MGSPTTSETSDLSLSDTSTDKQYPSVTGAYVSQDDFEDGYGDNHEAAHSLMAEESTSSVNGWVIVPSREPSPAWPCSATAPAARRSLPPCRSKADMNRSGRSGRAGKFSRHDG